MKWMLAGLLSAVLLLGLMGCGKKETADEPNKAAEKPDVTIDYGALRKGGAGRCHCGDRGGIFHLGGL